MKFFAALTLVLCFAIPAEGQIFKRRVCNNGVCRVVHHPVVQHQRIVRGNSVREQIMADRRVGVASVGECSDERQAWEQADADANTAIVQRWQAKNAEQAAAADVTAAEQALATAQAAHAEAQQTLNQATANVVDKTQAAEDAYKAWRICIIQ